MKIINNIISSWKQIPYTLKHWIIFLLVQEEAIEYCSFLKRSYFHDWDKLGMYIFLPFLGVDRINQIHIKHASHHPESGKTMKDIQNIFHMICDWECTKPLNARETGKKYYPEMDLEVYYAMLGL